MLALEQCVILAGGLGTRLGNLTKQRPKPLLSVGDRPFLSYLVHEAVRFGFKRILLLAGYLSDHIEDFVRETVQQLPVGVSITVIAEPEPMGTGGALRFALPHLEEQFLLLNGDSWFCFNWLDLAAVGNSTANWDAVLSLRSLEDTGRYGVVRLHEQKVVEFHERGDGEPGYVNAGVYLIRRSYVETFPDKASLEKDLLPVQAAAGKVLGVPTHGFFIDIGVPNDFIIAQDAVPKQLVKPAVFFDRDGVLNRDLGYTHKPEDLVFTEGAEAAVKRINDAGYYVFVVTNQSGVARGFYDESAVLTFNSEMQRLLRSRGAHVDDWRYCPYMLGAPLKHYDRAHPWRKPEPGMITDLIKNWPVSVERSFLVGDKESDIEAAKRAGIKGFRYQGGDLDQHVRAILAAQW